ncbi:MAG: glycosyltransferase family 2 protein [Firmicutes bacterium]|nr:glycosyltransferase family 2 protein [Bacillota bacterium]
MIPCYNEEENVVQMYKAVKEQLETNLSRYDYEILFIDNNSTDNTRALLRTVCKDDKKVKAIFNAKNFGQFNSPYHAMCQTTGDCTVCLCCDFQDPPELIPQFVKEWENGYMIVSGIKAKSKENPFVRLLRTIYYKMIKKMSDVEQIEHFTGFGLYDKSFIKVLTDLNDPIPFLRGIVAELGYKRKDIMYEQHKRAAGKTHNNWYSLYDAAMLSFTSYTKIGLRIATIAGFLMSFASFLIAVVYLILKLIFWNNFPVGIAPLIILVSIIGSVQLFFIGLLGEYILNINKRLMNRPLVVEEERINFDTE